MEEDLLGKLAGATTLSHQVQCPSASWCGQLQHPRHQIPHLLHTPPARTCPRSMDSCHRCDRAFWQSHSQAIRKPLAVPEIETVARIAEKPRDAAATRPRYLTDCALTSPSAHT